MQIKKSQQIPGANRLLAPRLSLTRTVWAWAFAAAMPVLAQPVPAPQPGASAAAPAARQQAFEGTVEAVRQTILAAQVAGAVQQLSVKAGQTVAAGQVLLRIDARVAEQGTQAAQAQAAAAQAAAVVAAQDLERKRQLHARQYISKAALEQAQAAYDAARAAQQAAQAQIGVAQAQSGFHVVRAPYAGTVSAVAVELGDMAAPGRPLLTLHDPAALRVTVSLPAALAAAPLPRSLRVELAGTGLAALELPATAVQVLPTVDAQTLTRQVRVDLPPRLGPAVVPGVFARLWWPAEGTGSNAAAGAAAAAGPVRVPVKALVLRGEMTGVYVRAADGKPLLRQVRLARPQDGWVEVLSGVQPGETVIEDAATALRRQP